MFYPTPESGARKIRHQIVWQTRQKPTPVFWHRFLERVSLAIGLHQISSKSSLFQLGLHCQYLRGYSLSFTKNQLEWGKFTSLGRVKAKKLWASELLCRLSGGSAPGPRLGQSPQIPIVIRYYAVWGSTKVKNTKDKYTIKTYKNRTRK